MCGDRDTPLMISSLLSENQSISKTKYLKDYKKPPYVVDHVRLEFKLDDLGMNTEVYAKLCMTQDSVEDVPLVLDGELLNLIPGSLKIDGQVVPDNMFLADDNNASLVIDQSILPPRGTKFRVESIVEIKPAENLALSGLYMSSTNYCTQCEAEGFRRITYFPDRPDCMAKYSVRITASKKRFPVLLSNGNCVASGIDSNDQSLHWVEYEDPYNKPCYLFALVAGDLVFVEDEFKTFNGRDVTLRIYVQGEKELLKCSHAMESLKNAMKWDEEVYGLGYDLNIYNVVAVPDFTMGAMENKSLNIFNSKYILASKDTATDTDFNNVEGVVGHEYFHNYSGNRVTVNSWFELSLKEGFTNFRDQTFSEDMRSASVKRISDVSALRTVQFAEDSGPLAHPIRPHSYQTINNFYTSTVYEKGSEVIRMLRTLCGVEGFRRGTDLYFSRHDGQAITCIDWLNAIHEANPNAFDLKKFSRWYSQAGTPEVTVKSQYCRLSKTLTLIMTQFVPPTHKQPEKLPATIPITTGIIGPDGEPVMVDLGIGSTPSFEKVLVLSEQKQSFVLLNVPEGSLPSMLRNFSAPVKLNYEQGETIDSLAFQMENDTDEFNKWEAGQKLALKVIRNYINRKRTGTVNVPAKVIDAFKKTLANKSVPCALRAQLLHLPSESYIIDHLKQANPMKVRKARSFVQKELANSMHDIFWNLIEEIEVPRDYSLDPKAQGARALRNIALRFLGKLEDEKIYKMALDQMRNENNMTDVQAAFSLLVNSNSELKHIAVKEFYEKWKKDRLVVDKWMKIQATSTSENVLDSVKALMNHEAFNINIPNCVYAVIRSYAHTNLHFEKNGEGYEFLADQILKLDDINPQVAARVARVFTSIGKYDKNRQNQMKSQLLRIKSKADLSKDVLEVVETCLESIEG